MQGVPATLNILHAHNNAFSKNVHVMNNTFQIKGKNIRTPVLNSALSIYYYPIFFSKIARTAHNHKRQDN